MEEKYYAFAAHESIQAMQHALFRFQTAHQAQLVTNKLAAQFILAPKLSDPKDKKSFALWVRDFAVTAEEQKLGYIGHFGRISIQKLPQGKWTLSLTKLDVPLQKHPQRKIIKRPHPNMGHPLLRAASRNKTWPSMQAAAEELLRLHEEFPEISIPGLNRLRIMTYIKEEQKGVSPIQRLELNVVKRDEGVYAIEIKNLSKQPKKKHPREMPGAGNTPVPVEQAAAIVTTEQPASTPPPAPSGKPKGFYTDMVAKQRKRKKK